MTARSNSAKLRIVDSQGIVISEAAAVLEAKFSKYDRYVDEITEDIAETIQQFGCQPILFVGTGLSMRFFGAPSWDGLLAHLGDSCPAIEKGLGFYKQSFQTALKIGDEFARLYQEWAWAEGRNLFPDVMFDEKVDRQAYLKFKIAEHLKGIQPNCFDDMKTKWHADELEAMRAIMPHAIITTNYDQMIEAIFPDHQPIIGQQILKGSQVSIGEIYKIHGCVSDYNSLVFTQTDYDLFTKKKKFLSAKLLTFFNEHPPIFIGYSATDPNIRAILSDIDEALPEKGGVIPNVYILQWNPDLTAASSPAREKVIPTEGDRSVRVKLIEASNFSWVLNAFSANPVLNDVNIRVLRALIARSYSLVRHDIPRMTVHADFKMLDAAVKDSNSFASLFGIANISDYSAASAQYPYSATELGIAIGGSSWHAANRIIDEIAAKTTIYIKGSDNRYHRTEKVNKTPFHKYSDHAVTLLKAWQAGEQPAPDIN